METPICSKCGDTMVLRIAKKTGKKFWGCSNFPKCQGDYKPYFGGEYKKIVAGSNYTPMIIKNPSDYQLAIKDFFIKELSTNLIVEATAGSGKSSTCRWLLEFAKPNEEIAFIAFNKDIADDNAIKCPPSVKACTSHSLFLEQIKNAWGKILINKYKTENILKLFLEENEADQFTTESFKANINNICKIISLFKNTLFEVNEENFEKIISKYNISIESDQVDFIFEIVQYAFEQSNLNKHELDFDDMLYFVVLYDIQCKKFDTLLIDEAQDLNALQMECVTRAIKNDGRIICVGDRYQSIYGFRGADTEAIPTLIKKLNANTLPLSISYRCPTENVKLINQLYPHIRIECAPNAIDGEFITIKVSEMADTIKEKDMVICRNNAPLIKPCFSLIKKGIKAMIKGREIGQDLVNFINQARGVKKNNVTDINTLIDYLEIYRIKESDKAQRQNNISKIDFINDKVDTIEALCENADSIEEVLTRINDIFKRDGDGVVFSTIHKAKGLQADNVYLIQPELIPSPKATTQEEIQQENNIFFVAYTRNMKKMYLVNKA